MRRKLLLDYFSYVYIFAFFFEISGIHLKITYENPTRNFLKYCSTFQISVEIIFRPLKLKCWNPFWWLKTMNIIAIILHTRKHHQLTKLNFVDDGWQKFHKIYLLFLAPFWGLKFNWFEWKTLWGAKFNTFSFQFSILCLWYETNI